MRGLSEYILQQARNYYPNIENAIDKIQYTITEFDGIERIKFTLEEEGCPMYCVCDDRYMSWYGDHGSFTFDCSWKTSLRKIPFNSPSYLFTKLDRCGARGTGLIWNGELARKNLLEYIYESDWWSELDDEPLAETLKEDLKSFFEGPYYKDTDDYYTGKLDDSMLDRIKDLINSAHEEWAFIQKLNDMEETDVINSDDEWLYECGNEITPHFWFILFALNIIYAKEIEKDSVEEQ